MTKTKRTDFYGGKPPQQIPAYTVGEVASYLQLPKTTVRAWTLGRNTRHGRFQPVCAAADAKARMLSFENLIEVHVLSSLRREHEVKLDAVRKAVRFLAKNFETAHPLAELDVLTDSTHIFIERYSKLLNVSRDGQAAMQDMVKKYLTRIDRNPRGESLRLFPITRTGVEVDRAPKFVAIDPRFKFGRPFLVKCGIETAVIAGRHKAGDSVREIALDLDVGEDAVEEAIRYEPPVAA